MPATFAARPPERAKHIRLPRTAPRAQSHQSYCKLVRRVNHVFHPTAFEGPICRAGTDVSADALGERAVVLEHAGPAGPAVKAGSGWGRGREYLYILWQYHWGREEWIELAQVRAAGAEWVEALRPLAAAALAPPRPELVDVGAESERIVGKVMDIVESELGPAVQGVRIRSLDLLYERLAARIAQNAA